MKIAEITSLVVGLLVEANGKRIPIAAMPLTKRDASIPSYFLISEEKLLPRFATA